MWSNCSKGRAVTQNLKQFERNRLDSNRPYPEKIAAIESFVVGSQSPRMPPPWCLAGDYYS